MRKVLIKPLWIVLSVFFALVFATCIVGSDLAFKNAGAVNNYLNVLTYRQVKSSDDEGKDYIYFKSPYLNEDGTYDDDSLIEANKQTVVDVQGEGSVLLWNNGALPLAKGDKISLFGARSVDLFRSGEGSGASQSRASYNLKNALEKQEGITVNNTLWQYYNSSSVSSYKLSSDDVGKKVKEVPWSALSEKAITSLSSHGDAAVFVISRKGGEGVDLVKTGADTVDGSYLSLSAEERGVLANLIALKGKTFKKIVVLLNTPGAVQFKDLKDYMSAIDACLWVGQPGMYGAYGIAAVLSGSVNPSGRTVDAFAYDNLKAPAVTNMVAKQYSNNSSFDISVPFQGTYLAYEEGIYVGYRYYETRYEDSVLNRGNTNGWKYAEEVIYPFGYGLSYSEFEYSNFSVKENRNGYTVSLKVKNTSSVPGKEVVQVYLQKPYTDYDKQNGIEKAAVELVGFVKTDTIAGGSTADVNIEIDKERFKTYDAIGKQTYIVEGSEDYYLAVGVNSHDALNNILAAKGITKSNGMDYDGKASFAQKLSVKEDLKTYAKSSRGYAVTNRFDHADWNRYDGSDGKKITYLSRSDWQGTFPKGVNLSMTQTLARDTSWDIPVVEKDGAKMPTYGKNNGLLLIMMKDLPYDSPVWEDFMDQLTWEECSELSANAMKSTIAIKSIVKPQEVTEDGPLGMNRAYTTSGERTMSFPTSPVVAATWNASLIEKMGVQKGADMMHSGATGIYAPAMNLHRSQYGGRNYEYYSEDGYLSGVIGLAETKGIQSLGCYVTLKHFALNDQETNRTGVSIWSDEQAIRELYLLPFQMSVEQGGARSVMSSFTRVGALWNGADYNMCTEVLRNEWGFEGFVISDCAPQVYMTFSSGVLGGNDCTLYSNPKDSFALWKNSPTVMQALRQSCKNILYTVANSNVMNTYSSNTKIELVTPWWQPAIIAIDVFVGILFVGCVTLSVLCYVFKKKKEVD